MGARYLTDEEGARVGVLLSIEEYEALIEAAEEAEDLKAAAVFDRVEGEIARGESEVIPWEESKARRRDQQG